jgi:hypothetical protein
MTRRGLRSHPARDAILDTMRQYGKPISPTQLARVTGATLGSTAYHVRTMLAAGMIELVDEARVRGTVEHFYTLPAGTEAAAPIDAARQLLSVCGALTVPGPDGGYPVPTELDEDAHAELEALLDGLRPQVQQIAAASTARARRGRG